MPTTMMSGTMQDGAAAVMIDEKKKTTKTKRIRFLSIKKMGEKTGLSLASVRRSRLNNNKNGIRRKYAPRPQKRYQKIDTQMLNLSPAPSDDDTLSPSSTTGESSNLDLLEHSGAIQTTDTLDTPMSDVQGQELFKGSPDKKGLLQQQQGDDAREEEEAPKPQKKVRFSFEDDLRQDRPQTDYIPLSSLSGVSPRTLETIIESTSTNVDDEDSLSLGSTASLASNTEFSVTFSPAKEVFLRTLAMERATALEMAIAAESLQNDASKTSTLVKGNIKSRVQVVTLNGVLTFAIAVMLLLDWFGASEQVIGGIQASFRLLWNGFLALLGNLLSAANAVNQHKHALFNYEHDEIGAWLSFFWY